MGADARMSAELDTQQRLDADAPADGTKHLHEQPVSAEEASQTRAALAEGSAAATFALLGARHDFSVSDPSGAVSCRCVAALLGPPSSGKLKWQGEMPRTKPETQLVVALVPDADCPGAPASSGGASYWGYRIEGNDVVVLLEDWSRDRPRTLGAIIPKPPANGQVYLTPVSRKLPFGLPSAGSSGRCALGNPGPKRSEPLSGSEAGAAPAEAE